MDMLKNITGRCFITELQAQWEAEDMARYNHAIAAAKKQRREQKQRTEEERIWYEVIEEDLVGPGIIRPNTPGLPILQLLAKGDRFYRGQPHKQQDLHGHIFYTQDGREFFGEERSMDWLVERKVIRKEK